MHITALTKTTNRSNYTDVPYITEHAPTQNSFGDRAFSAVGPKIWTNLPPELRHVNISFGQFRNMLKSYLFRF